MLQDALTHLSLGSKKPMKSYLLPNGLSYNCSMHAQIPMVEHVGGIESSQTFTDMDGLLFFFPPF